MVPRYQYTPSFRQNAKLQAAKIANLKKYVQIKKNNAPKSNQNQTRVRVERSKKKSIIK